MSIVGGADLSQGIPNSGRSHSLVPQRPQISPEGYEMLLSMKRKRETEVQLKVLENRIKKLKEQEESTKAKNNMQRR